MINFTAKFLQIAGKKKPQLKTTVLQIKQLENLACFNAARVVLCENLLYFIK